MQVSIQSAKSVLIIVTLVVLILPSCVSKKKFVEMEGYRTRAEQRVVELTKEVADLKVEFEQYNNKFYYNNSVKDQMIDSLSNVIVSLHSDLSSKSENIEDQIFSFQVEKRRLNQLLADKDREIRIAQRNAEMLKVKADDLQREIDDANVKLRNSESTAAANERAVAMKDGELEKLKNQIEKQSGDLVRLQKEMTKKNEEIEALNNQVKLLKSQFGQN